MKCKITHEEYMKMSRENEIEIRKAGENFKKVMNRLITATKEFGIEIKKLRRKLGYPTWLSG